MREIRGIGIADYSPLEDHLARRLIADGNHGEVAVLHALKVELDARPHLSDPESAFSWATERRETDPHQEVLI